MHEIKISAKRQFRNDCSNDALQYTSLVFKLFLLQTQFFYCYNQQCTNAIRFNHMRLFDTAWSTNGYLGDLLRYNGFA